MVDTAYPPSPGECASDWRHRGCAKLSVQVIENTGAIFLKFCKGVRKRLILLEACGDSRRIEALRSEGARDGA